MRGQVRTVFHDNLILETMREIAQERGYKFKSIPEVLKGFNEWNSVNCAMFTKEFYVMFDVQQMPGCCAVLALSYVKPEPRTVENFDTVVQFVEEAAYRASFGSVVMTQVVPAYSKMLWKEQLWIKCLDREWVASPPFCNAKSGNLVTYLTRDLGQKGQVEGFERVKVGG